MLEDPPTANDMEGMKELFTAASEHAIVVIDDQEVARLPGELLRKFALDVATRELARVQEGSSTVALQTALCALIAPLRAVIREEVAAMAPLIRAQGSS